MQTRQVRRTAGLLRSRFENRILRLKHKITIRRLKGTLLTDNIVLQQCRLSPSMLPVKSVKSAVEQSI